MSKSKNPPSGRNYAHEYAIESPQRKKFRAKRNAARRELMAEGIVRKGDGKDVDHKVPLSKGGGVSRSNLRAQSAHANRSYKRTSSGAIKGK
jgi:hypothetical protein